MSRAAGVIARGRRKAEPLMTDQCEIRPVTGEVTDPVTGEVTTEYGDPVYGPGILPDDGKCKIQNQRLRYPESPDAGDHRFYTAVTEIHLPVTEAAADVQTNDVVEIVASRNPSNVGRKVRVEAADLKTFQTAIRLITREVLA